MDGPANGSPLLKLGRSPLVSSISPSYEQKELVVPAVLDVILDDDEDFELTFSLDAQQRAAAESLAQSRQALRSEEYRQLFHLPPEEVLIQDFNCALQKKILLQGHMYLFEHYVCFYSNIFGYEKKKVIVLKDVTSVHKARTAGLFPNAIEIVAWGKKSFFASFLSRDEAYRLILEGWSRHSRNAILDSDSQSNLSILTSHHVQTAQEQNDACFSESSFGSRDIVEVSTELSVEAEHAAENGGEVNDTEITEVLLPTVDSSNAAGNKDAQVTEGSPAKENKESTFWEVEDEDAPKLPEHYKTILECEFPVDVNNFFQLFFSNDSIKFCESFHKKCGDEDFQCTKWAKDQHFGHVRDVSFRHRMKIYFGPKTSNCQEVQRYRIYRNSHLIVETSQQMNDIPYRDYFRVEGRWDVVPLIGRVTPHCVVRVFVDVPFSKKTVWKGKIEQGTYDECKEVYGTWLAEAFRSLQEKGLVDYKPTKVENTSQSTETDKHSGSMKAKPKRKLEAGFGQTQGHGKISKNSSTALSSQNFSENGLRQREQPLQTLPSAPVKASQHLQQQFSIAGFTCVSQAKLVIVICIMAVLFLIQTGVIIALRRSSKVQYIPLTFPRGGECHETLRMHCGRQDAAWLEQSAQLLKEEVIIVEARLQNIQHRLNHLMVDLKLAEKFPQNAASSTG